MRYEIASTWISSTLGSITKKKTMSRDEKRFNGLPRATIHRQAIETGGTAMRPFWIAVSFLTFLFGALSIASLIQEGLDVGIAAPLLRLLNYYKKSLDVFLSWADPPIVELVQILKNWVHIDWRFNPWWKYLFAPIWLYFSAAAATVLVAQKRIFFFIVDFTFGCVTALGTSVASSAFPLDTSSPIPVIIISAGFVAFGLCEIPWHRGYGILPNQNRSRTLLWFAAAFPLANLIIAIVVVAFSWASASYGYPIPAIAQILFIVVSMALRSLVAAAYGATFLRKSGEDWLRNLLAYGTFKHGWRVLSVIGAAVFFIACGRGLERFGL